MAPHSPFPDPEFVFDAGQTDMAGRVRGMAKITAPRQNGNDIAIAAQPIPPDPDSLPPAGKGIQRIIRTVIHPHVTDKTTGTALTSFDPPLILTVSYGDDDLAGVSKGPDGNPQLCLITFYNAGGTWHWQKLATTVDPVQQTLTAKLDTLTPLDPVGVGA